MKMFKVVGLDRKSFILGMAPNPDWLDPFITQYSTESRAREGMCFKTEIEAYHFKGTHNGEIWEVDVLEARPLRWVADFWQDEKRFKDGRKAMLNFTKPIPKNIPMDRAPIGTFLCYGIILKEQIL
jgi:hypothetical protein